MKANEHTPESGSSARGKRHTSPKKALAGGKKPSAIGRVVPNGEMLLRSEIARLQQLLTITTEALTHIRLEAKDQPDTFHYDTLRTIQKIANRAILRVEHALATFTSGEKPESTSTAPDEG